MVAQDHATALETDGRERGAGYETGRRPRSRDPQSFSRKRKTGIVFPSAGQGYGDSANLDAF
jgi:hypothetical protein